MAQVFLVGSDMVEEEIVIAVVRVNSRMGHGGRGICVFSDIDREIVESDGRATCDCGQQRHLIRSGDPLLLKLKTDRGR